MQQISLLKTPPNHFPYPGSTSVVTTTSTPSTTPAEERGVVIRNQSRKKKMSSRRRLSRTPSLEADGGGGEGEGGGRGSVPSTPDSTATMQLGGDGSQVSESDTVTVHSPVSRTGSAPETTPPRTQGAKVRLSGSYSVPLTVIEEPVGETEDNEQGLTPAGEDEESERLRRFQRSPSPSLQVPPSPVRGFSPNSSPRNTRKKTRIAVRRTRSNKREWKHKIIGGNINEKTPCLV